MNSLLPFKKKRKFDYQQQQQQHQHQEKEDNDKEEEATPSIALVLNHEKIKKQSTFSFSSSSSSISDHHPSIHFPLTIHLHPRNPFALNSPNFEIIASSVEELRPCLIRYKDSKDKPNVTINFKNINHVQTLTKAIFKYYFDLKVNFPSHTLCPMIPNRLNYLLEIEDLLHLVDYHGPVTVLDIGTGYSCVFPLLGCRLFNHWSFIGTDIDPNAISNAQHVISENQLSHHIKVHLVSPSAPFFSFPWSSSSTSDSSSSSSISSNNAPPPFTITMCNPPFYSDLNQKQTSRQSKLSPHSFTPTTSTESFTQGGEVQFVSNMLLQSSQQSNLKNHVQWFTSLLGFHSSIQPLKQVANQLEPPPSMVLVRELKQGQTKRYVLAWTWSSSPRLLKHYWFSGPPSFFVNAIQNLPQTQLHPLPMESSSSFIRLPHLPSSKCQVYRFTLNAPSWTRSYLRATTFSNESHSSSSFSHESVFPIHLCSWTYFIQQQNKTLLWLSVDDSLKKKKEWESFLSFLKRTLKSFNTTIDTTNINSEVIPELPGSE